MKSIFVFGLILMTAYSLVGSNAQAVRFHITDATKARHEVKPSPTKVKEAAPKSAPVDLNQK